MKGTVSMKQVNHIGLSMWARILLATHPTARPTRMPMRKEKKNMPLEWPRESPCPAATCSARVSSTRVVPSLMSASALRVVMEDLGSLPLRVATATASVGASATPMSSAAAQLLTPMNSCRIPATPKAVTMTSRVPVRIMPRMRLRASRHEVLRASQKSMMGRKISRMTCGGRPILWTSCSSWAGISPMARPTKISTIAGVTRVLCAIILPTNMARARAITTSSMLFLYRGSPVYFRG